jgi:2-amino-4-hydroxy-6-hydroxymethyldihydropteridine diphosphokinase
MGHQCPGRQEICGVIAFIGIGSNLEMPAAACLEAMRILSTTRGMKLLRRSSLYQTEPIGPQQPWFINAVAEIRTGLTPWQLFTELKGIERRMGRTEGTKWGPRIIDLDILLYGQEVLSEETLTIPHPELHRRRFVLVPLCELASYVIHPVFGISARGLIDRVTDQSLVDIYEPAAADR